jgi:hypothetical protein
VHEDAPTVPIALRHLTPDDWRDWRALRLLALEESPEAFGATIASWQDADEERWRARLADVALNLLAVDDHGRALGMASGVAPDAAPPAQPAARYCETERAGPS